MKKDYKKLAGRQKKESDRGGLVKKISRLIAELSMLCDKPYPLEKMAAELGVELRTVQRDMRLLESAGLPIYSPIRGCRAFPEGYSLEKLKVSGREAALFAMFSNIALSLGESFSGTMDNLRAKMLGPKTENPYYIMLPGGCPLPEHPLLKDIEEAVCQHEKIEIKYRGGRKPQYYIKPLRIVWSEGFWYLLAMEEETRRMLTFFIDKITSVYRIGMYFVPPADIDSMLAGNINIWISARRSITAVMEVDAGAAMYFRRRLYFPEQAVKETRGDGSIIIECRAADTRAIFPVVLSWLPHIKIISPVSLKEQLNSIIRDYLKNCEMKH